MFADAGFAAVIPFGYEHSTPLLAQYQHLIETQAELATIRSAPDFLLVKADNTHVALVDVKYRAHAEPKTVREIAEKVCRRWETAWLFLATPEGFFMGQCKDIIHDNGVIDPLDPRLIRMELQQQYLALLREFKPHT
jgi:hypothetical protein